MQKSLLNILVDPIDKSPLTLDAVEVDRDEVVAGQLHSQSGRIYQITDYIPRFNVTEDVHQKQTQESFGFKWEQENTYGSTAQMEVYANWLTEKYGFDDLESAQKYFNNRRFVLDAGCGSGFSSSCWLSQDHRTNSQSQWVGVDISTAIDVAYRHLGNFNRTHYVQGDVLQLPFAENSFDTIFSEGVLHHTPSTEQALKSLVPLLEPNGEILFYVYRKKGAIREFTDDYIRDLIADKQPQDAWEMLLPLSKLGEALAKLNVEVDVPEDIPYLGIKAGKIDIQRLIYWNVAKMYWNDAMTFEENHHINFDWYHPKYAHRQTEAEVRQWCEEAGLTIHHFDEQESGYTVRAIKN